MPCGARDTPLEMAKQDNRRLSIISEESIYGWHESFEYRGDCPWDVVFATRRGDAITGGEGSCHLAQRNLAI
jgi:hypothetical protein